jgi:hypothetical protein
LDHRKADGFSGGWSSDGRTWLWVGRSKMAGRGEAQSAPRFDVAVKRETLR